MAFVRNQRLFRQRRNRRIAVQKILAKEVATWQKDRNKCCAITGCKFASVGARIRLKQLNRTFG
jgi:hypothetical protein